MCLPACNSVLSSLGLSCVLSVRSQRERSWQSLMWTSWICQRRDKECWRHSTSLTVPVSTARTTSKMTWRWQEGKWTESRFVFIRRPVLILMWLYTVQDRDDRTLPLHQVLIWMIRTKEKHEKQRHCDYFKQWYEWNSQWIQFPNCTCSRIHTYI